MKRAKTRSRALPVLLRKLRMRKNDLLIVSALRQLSMEELDDLRKSLAVLDIPRAMICEGVTFTVCTGR